MITKRLLIFALIGLSLVGCRLWGVRGSGHLEREVRDVEDFNEIDVGGAFNVDINVSDDYYLEIIADDNLLQYITTRVKGRKLIIEERKDLNPRRDIKIKIGVPNLERLESSGANDIWADGINEDSFEVGMSGAGSIELLGDVNKIWIEISGAGSIDARKLYAKDAKVYISGAASAEVYASESLDAEVSGVGSIEFYGDPSDVKTDISGIGSIDRR
ncbi:head GIN domain-containing protein [Bacteroidota bacterium]